MSTTKNKKILISIVSYMETELENTVKRFFEDADYPNNLLFSIVSQDIEHPKLDFLDANQLRYIKVLPEDTYGVSWARALASVQFTDYDYYLQLDAHMFSEKSWDTKIIEVYEKTKEKNSKVVLSSYPASYVLEKNGERTNHGPIEHAQSFFEGTRFGDWPKLNSLSKITKGHYIQGALLFSEKDFILEVPVLSDVSFFLEETVNSIRAYQAGYEVYAFTSPVFFHFYAEDRVKYNGNPKPWDKPNHTTSLLALEKNTPQLQLLKKCGINYQKFLTFCKETGLQYE